MLFYYHLSLYSAIECSLGFLSLKKILFFCVFAFKIHSRNSSLGDVLLKRKRYLQEIISFTSAFSTKNKTSQSKFILKDQSQFCSIFNNIEILTNADPPKFPAKKCDKRIAPNILLITLDEASVNFIVDIV